MTSDEDKTCSGDKAPFRVQVYGVYGWATLAQFPTSYDACRDVDKRREHAFVNPGFRVVDAEGTAVQHAVGPQALVAIKRRPANYDKLSPRQQWEVDDRLGILDWDGSMET